MLKGFQWSVQGFAHGAQILWKKIGFGSGKRDIAVSLCVCLHNTRRSVYFFFFCCQVWLRISEAPWIFRQRQQTAVLEVVRAQSSGWRGLLKSVAPYCLRLAPNQHGGNVLLLAAAPAALWRHRGMFMAKEWTGRIYKIINLHSVLKISLWTGQQLKGLWKSVSDLICYAFNTVLYNAWISYQELHNKWLIRHFVCLQTYKDITTSWCVTPMCQFIKLPFMSWLHNKRDLMKSPILIKLYISITDDVATLLKAKKKKKKKAPINEEKKKTPPADANNQITSDTRAGLHL